MARLDSDDIGAIIAASDRAFGLLMWLGDLVDDGRISVVEARP